MYPVQLRTYLNKCEEEIISINENGKNYPNLDPQERTMTGDCN